MVNFESMWQIQLFEKLNLKNNLISDYTNFFPLIVLVFGFKCFSILFCHFVLACLPVSFFRVVLFNLFLLMKKKLCSGVFDYAVH